VIVLQGAVPAIEAAMARFRQWSDARGHTVEVELIARDVVVEKPNPL
jgi:hypothetical protein